jgi:DNA-binding HxlR family transcriptional regulator
LAKTINPGLETQEKLEQASILCPYGKLLEVLGKPHTLEIIYGLTIRSPLRFTQIQKELKLQPKTLTARMKELVKLGLVARTSYNEIPPRVDYELTQKGRDLDGIFKALNAWARKYNYAEQHRERMR